jgi:hypothetical protein
VTAAEKNIGAPVLTYPFSPIVDGVVVPHDTNIKNGPGHSQAVKDMLGKYDVLCGLKEGPVLPLVGRQLFNNIDMDRFVTAVIKLTMRMEGGSEPTAEAKRVYYMDYGHYKIELYLFVVSRMLCERLVGFLN